MKCTKKYSVSVIWENYDKTCRMDYYVFEIVRNTQFPIVLEGR